MSGNATIGRYTGIRFVLRDGLSNILVFALGVDAAIVTFACRCQARSDYSFGVQIPEETPMNRLQFFVPFLFSMLPLATSAQTTKVPPEITTPDHVSTSVGTLDFHDGMPSERTVNRMYDQLDFTRGVDSFLNGVGGVSVYALRKGLRDAGIKDNEGVILFSGLMDSRSLFLTANADTVYFWPFLDLRKGPMVVEVPQGVLGAMDDMWFRWVTDFGVPGPDRGQGGKYLIVPPDYKGPLPDGGYFIAHSKTYGVSVLGRAFLENDDPKPAAERIKAQLKIYPYIPGSYGTSIGEFLAGDAKLGPLSQPTTLTFVEGTGLAINTIAPNDYSYYAMLNDLVQDEPASALEPEIGGQFAAIGIAKGKPFQPDERMQKILHDAIEVANSEARVISFRPRLSAGFQYYDEKSAWMNQLFLGGYEFLKPPPEITKDGVKQFPDTGARTLDSRTSFFYIATGITPAMVMRLPNIGSQYIGAMLDAKGVPLDGSKTYKLVLPPKIPAGKFWSLTLYDNETRSMLQTPQRFPRAGSQNFPSPAAVAEPDGSIVLYCSPTLPAGVKASNWVQTDPGKGWWVLLRFYSPLEPFFDKSWRPGEFVEVK